MNDAPARTIRVMVVEDHDLMREATVRFLSAADDVEVVAAVGTMEDALAALTIDTGRQPDVVVLDMKLPGLSGSEGIPLLRGALPSLRILVLTMLESADARELVRSAGADGFLTKGCAPSELVEAVRTVDRGERVGYGTDARRSASAPTPARRRPDGLTTDEVAVLRLLLDSKSVGEIAALLGLGVRQVVTLVGAITDTTEASTRSGWLRYALDHDLL